MKLSVLSVCSQYSVEELLASSARAKAQSEFLNLQWEQTASIRDLEHFLPELQRSVDENAITVVLDGSENFYTKTLIANGLDLELLPSISSREAVEEYCRPRGLTLSGRMMEAALLPQGAEPMNSTETVDQGFVLIRGNCCIAVFPAGKKGFGDMFSNGFFPFLLRYGADTAVTQTIALRGSKVKDVEEYLRLFRYGKNILPLVYLEKGQPTLSITAVRKTEAESRQACESLLESIESEMGSVVLTAGNPKKDEKLSRKEVKKEKKRKKSKALQEIEDYNPIEENSKPQKEKSGFGKLRIFLLIICLCTFAVSAGYLGLRFYRSMSNLQEYDTLREVYDNGGLPPVGYPSDYDSAFSGLYQINQDVVGWLSIDGTSVDYPVVQYSDNDYYHRLNFEGESNLHGVPYVDYKVDMKAPSNNTIIYGHNVNNDDQMFNALVRYQKLDFYKEHPLINFHTVYGERQYKIFAAFVANVNPEHGEVFQYHTFVDADSVADMQEFLYNVQIRSVLNTAVDVLPSDELLTLSTCTYEFDNARFVVVARRVRDGESSEVDTSMASKNTNALMPDIWYELYGGTKPVLQAPTFEDTIVLSNQDKAPNTSKEENKKEESVPTLSPNLQTAPQAPVTEQSPVVQTPPEKLLEKVSISSAANAMTAGTTMNLKSVVEPVLDKVTYAWSSSDPAIATVSADGVVTAVAQGQVQINLTATNTDKTENTVTAAPLTLTINPAQPAEKVLVDGQDSMSLTLTEGEYDFIVVSGSNSYTWKSDNEVVATVDGKGTINAVKEGTAIITITGAKGDTAEITLTVKAKPEVVLLNDKESLNLELTVGTAYTVKAGGSTSYTWESSNKGVATVSSDGQILAGKEGTAVITVTGAKGDTAEILLTVKAKPEIILLNGKDDLELELTVGSTYTVTASGSTSYTWESDDEKVATVDKNGTITAVGEGIAFITATGAKGGSAELILIVEKTEETVLVDGKSALSIELKVDETYSPTASGSASYTWESDDEDVADVSKKGKITAISEGTATITVSGANGGIAEITVTVVKPASSSGNSGSSSNSGSSNSNDKLSVKINGSTVSGSAFDIVCQMVQAEMGTTFHQEALKAQAVAAYTYVKYNNAMGIKPSVATKTPISSNVKQAVQDVIGEAVYYNGAYINATYCAANAGVSNNCVDVWGGNLPYLVSVDSEGDEECIHYGHETRLDLDYVAERIEDYHNTDPWDYSSDPSDWFGKMTYGAGKYVNTVKLCGSNIKGRLVREGLLQSKIRSSAFEVEYDSSAKEFIFTTYGYGHGVGMSQLGANYYAKQGWTYDEILEHYYSGAVVK